MRHMGAAIFMLACLGAQAEQREWYGIVQQVPVTTGGQWKIGGQRMALAQDARVDLRVGPLEEGACAEVSRSGELAQSVTTLTMRHCDVTDYEAYFSRYRR